MRVTQSHPAAGLALLALLSAAPLAAQDRPLPAPAPADSVRFRTDSLRQLIDRLGRLYAFGPSGSTECPMPVVVIRGGAARRLTVPPDSSRLRPVPIPTVPSGCVNPLFPRR